MYSFFRVCRNDPAMSSSIAKQFKDWIGPNEPSLYAQENNDKQETATIDLPEYEIRQTMTGRDPLCCALAFTHTQ